MSEDNLQALPSQVSFPVQDMSDLRGFSPDQVRKILGIGVGVFNDPYYEKKEEEER